MAADEIQFLDTNDASGRYGEIHLDFTTATKFTTHDLYSDLLVDAVEKIIGNGNDGLISLEDSLKLTDLVGEFAFQEKRRNMRHESLEKVLRLLIEYQTYCKIHPFEFEPILQFSRKFPEIQFQLILPRLDRINEFRQITENQAYGLALQIDTLHLHKIFHRDIKTGNILMDQNGNYILIDFGGTFDAQRTIFSNIGAMQTIDPVFLQNYNDFIKPLVDSNKDLEIEQARHKLSQGNKIYQARDVYAFVLVFLQMRLQTPLWSNPDFGAPRDGIQYYNLLKSNDHDAQKIKEAMPASVIFPTSVLQKLNQAQFEVINRALSLNPLERYKTCTDFLNAFFGKNIDQ